VTDLGEHARSAFGLAASAPMTLAAVGRGALGRVFRLEIGSSRYALKELFGPDRPTDAQVAAEVSFAVRANATGVTVPLSHPAIDGGYLVQSLDGAGWLRLYDWADGVPLPVTATGTPQRVGTLLGRLHLCASPMTRESDGSAPDRWYERPPDEDVWPLMAERARDASWVTLLARRIPQIRDVTAMATPARTDAMIACHRDLHPDNILATPTTVTVIDWDDLGPADPGRELVVTLLDWFTGDDGTLDTDAVRTAVTAYARAGGPGRVTEDAYGFAIASRLNFLQRQIGIALDAAAEPEHRDWAVREIHEALAILPSRDLLSELLRAAGS
jgi:Ser/Thr protein kinase RdoA (MazF antagonist)